MSLISIIIPAYNAAQNLNRCIDSLLDQTIDTEFEIIVVDDGSTDDTANILREYSKKDSRVKWFYKENGGQSSARNLGLLMAKGDYIVFVDSDDYVENNYLLTLYNLIIENDLDISMCGVNRVKGSDGHGKRFESGFYHDFITEDTDKLLLTSSFAPWNKMFKKAVWEDKKFPEHMTYEDFATIPQIMYSAKKIGYVHDILYHYYINPDSTIMRSKRKKKSDRNILKAYNILENSILNQRDDILENLFIRVVLLSLAWSIVKYGEIDAKEVLDDIVNKSKRYPNIRSNVIIPKLSFDRRLFLRFILNKQYVRAKIVVIVAIIPRYVNYVKSILERFLPNLKSY